MYIYRCVCTYMHHWVIIYCLKFLLLFLSAEFDFMEVINEKLLQGSLTKRNSFKKPIKLLTLYFQ